MKKLLLISLLALAACHKKSDDPKPATVENAPLAPIAGAFSVGGGVAVRVAVRDSATGEYLRPYMSCNVFFYPPEWTEAQVRTQALFDKRLGWLMVPTVYWQRGTISATSYYPDNTALLSILSKANAVILWQFPDSDKARPRYSEYYQYLGVLTTETRQDIVIDRKKAGL